MKSAILALCVIVALGVLSTPDYVLDVERENEALRAKVAALSAERVRADACTESGLVAAHLMIARGE
ncbi:MAG: hypothetical protein ACRCTX_26435 [Afipia sp.]